MGVSIQKNIFPALMTTIQKLTAEFNEIHAERKATIALLTQFIMAKRNHHEKALLNFICTHNSRRSHMAQIWAQTAAHYFNIKNVETYSGGTEATAFNPRAVKAMIDAGFNIVVKKDGVNPVYEVAFSSDTQPLLVYSKKYDDAANPKVDFAAVMTCSHADEHCPLITGSAARIALTYDDPKDFDNTSLEQAKYTERVWQIGREILFAFADINN